MNRTGFQTSEFIVSLIPILGGIALIIIGAIKGMDSLVNTGMLLSGIGSGGYSLSRGLAKFGAGAAQPAPAASAPPVDDKAAADAVAKVP